MSGEISVDRGVDAWWPDECSTRAAGGFFIFIEQTGGEGVFTPGQMAAMGGGGGDVTVNLINKSGQDLNAKSSGPKFDAGKMVLDIVLDAAVRNKGGFKTSMKGALS